MDNKNHEDTSKDWRPDYAFYEDNIMNRIRIRTIFELLVEKGIVTDKEIDDKINYIKQRDYRKLLDYFCFGIKENT